MIFKPFIMLLFLGLASALSGDSVDQVLATCCYKAGMSLRR